MNTLSIPLRIDINRPIRILIVDDDKVIADLLKDIIAKHESSREATVCYDGKEAVDSINSNSFDLIITDLVMPRLGGMEVLRYAKQINPDVLVIIVTGFASLETAVMSIKAGAYDYIMKPCKLDEIRIVVDRAADKIKLNRENKELLKKLREAYHELMLLNQKKDGSGKIASLNFFSSSIAGLHYLYNNVLPDNSIDKLQVLSTLKEKGLLTESEFNSFKKHYLDMLNN